MARVLWLLPLLLIGTGCKQATPAAPAPDARAEIEAVMRDSAAGWNGGDLDRFMAIYADDPTISFLTRNGLIRGKATITARYAPASRPAAMRAERWISNFSISAWRGRTMRC